MKYVLSVCEDGLKYNGLLLGAEYETQWIEAVMNRISIGTNKLFHKLNMSINFSKHTDLAVCYDCSNDTKKLRNR